MGTRRCNPERYTPFTDLALHGINMEQLENQLGPVLKRKVDLGDGRRLVEEPLHGIRKPGPERSR